HPHGVNCGSFAETTRNKRTRTFFTLATPSSQLPLGGMMSSPTEVLRFNIEHSTFAFDFLIS
ncbi:MAG TPA: hypothetical protein VGA84_10350, partial [Thermoanaerobaculia bacterium]